MAVRRSVEGVRINEGLAVIRRCPELYLGRADPERSLRARLVEMVLVALGESRLVTTIRLLVWRGGALTIAFDGKALPIAPVRNEVVPQPRLYYVFMALGVEHALALPNAGAVLNAFSDWLVVSTMHGGRRYRAAFSRGTLATMLASAPCDKPLGASWMTFIPDASLLPGELSPWDAAKLVARLRIKVQVADRTTEDPDWS